MGHGLKDPKIEENHLKMDVAVLPLVGVTLPILNGVIKS